jgi:hemerythrin-like domain-containing protein
MPPPPSPSSVSLPGFSSPGASTEAPLEMLAACHGRIERQCETLQRLLPHVQAHGADAAAQQAARAVMRYFDSAAVHHHEDEEQDLFPALREAMAGSDAVCIRELTDGLVQDHRRLEGLWRALRAALVALAEGQAQTLDAAVVGEFMAAYEAHMARENDELLPMAARLLDDATLARIGQAMRERRGIPAP